VTPPGTLDALAGTLPRTILVVGKGGVGKTTCAVALGRRMSEIGHRTLIVSTDPAAALADVLGAPVTTSATLISANLDARQLDAAQLRDEFLGKWRDTIAEIVDRGTYLDRAEVDGLVDAALPGVDEIFALLALADLLADPSNTYARIVVDTAPTGHTLRLLALPETFSALVSMLDLMQSKHRFMVKALTRRYRRDRADDFLDDMRGRINRLRATLADERSLAAVLVTRVEPVVEAESRRYLEQLRALHVRIAAVIVNAGAPGTEGYTLDASVPHVWIKNRRHPERKARRTPRPRSTPLGQGSPYRASLATLGMTLPTLTIVGGKGGVGKSTCALALAIRAADENTGRVLLVSTDPAPSIADALGETGAEWTRTDVEHEPAGVPNLVVRQMDAGAAFSRIRDQYQERIDALFQGLMSRGVDATHDRAVLRDLLALAPPGIDELFALSLLGDALAEQRFTRIVVDPAPTGHLLRLLDMPAIALDWTHRLMRLILKYREVVGLGDTAQELLDFAKRTRALEVLLRTPALAGMVIVSLDEPVVRAETTRLSAAVKARGVDLIALIWNRASSAPTPLPATVAARQFVARETSPPPVGADAIRSWLAEWQEFSPLT
jgi:arsenite/tail-anchored protein-transporting ATPase